jgi:hypothetical protein
VGNFNLSHSVHVDGFFWLRTAAGGAKCVASEAFLRVTEILEPDHYVRQRQHPFIQQLTRVSLREGIKGS